MSLDVDLSLKSVLIQVEEQRKEDDAAGNEIAIQLEGKINRKVLIHYHLSVVKRQFQYLKSLPLDQHL